MNYKMMLSAFILIFAATLFRIVPPLLHLQHSWLMNFSPLAAIVFCGALYFPKRWAVCAPLLILGVSDVILNVFAYSFPIFTWEILSRYVAFLAIGLATFFYRNQLKQRVLPTLAGCLLASVVFYLVTNTASWIGDPGYAKNITGWAQSMTHGLPGYAPTWTFFRNSLIGDLIFTGLFISSMAVTNKKTIIVPAVAVAAH